MKLRKKKESFLVLLISGVWAVIMQFREGMDLRPGAPFPSGNPGLLRRQHNKDNLNNDICPREDLS